MDNELFMFYRNSLSRNLCREYSDMFKKNLGDKKRMISLAMQQQSIPYVATSIYEGWGVDIGYLKNNYKGYINGRYSLKDCDMVQGYSYELWCDYKASMKVKTDIVHMVQCECDVNVRQTKCPTIYVSNKSNINLKSQGYNTIIVYLFDDSIINIDNTDSNTNIIVYKYSDNAKVIIGDKNEGKIKKFDKTLRL